MATVNMTAECRTATGKGAARKIRRDGLTPAIIYRDGVTPSLISLDAKELEIQFLRTGDPNTLVNISFGDEQRVCLVREVQRHPVSAKIRHIDFFEVHDDEPITISVPVEPIGRAVGTRIGGTLQLVRRRMNVRCKPGDIPASVQVDVTPMGIGQFIRASQIPAPKNTELTFTEDFNVVSVVGKHVLVEEVEAAEEV
jgi:large subunit ribosomal protein L25